VRFVDFLKTTVLLSGGAATVLAAVTVLAAATHGQESLRLLSSARASTTLPEHHPGAILLNRLWPLLVFTIVAGGVAFLAPQVPGIAAGFAIIWSLAWRRQEAAVTAIEERDGAYFYVCRTSPVRPIVLERTPGFKALRPERVNGAVG